MQHIFEPFFQGDPDNMEMGTGVGLALVKQILDAIGGEIIPHCQTGHGAVFTVTIPLRHDKGGFEVIDDDQIYNFTQKRIEDTTTLMAATSDSSEATDTSLPKLGQRVLVVEDNRDVALYIGLQLSETYDISYAYNGEIGIKKAEDIVPDLIITDLMMPEMDGLELCRRVRDSEIISHVPIIIITAKASDEQRIRGIEAGADAYLYKPFSPDELKMRVSKLLEQRQLLREKFSVQQPQQDNSDLLPSKLDTQFLARVTDIVYSFMKRGKVDVDTIASELCLSPSQFRRKVVSITGQTPATYIMAIRMSNAQRLLDSHPEWTVSQVAECCGFADSAYFANVFKRHYGISPTQYARRPKG